MKVYLVGGAVRDTLMGKDVNDRDYVVVGSTPEELVSLGYKEVGASFGVFLHPKTGEEYALARTERKTGAGHTAFEVDVSKEITLEDDLRRRDLTINSMAQDLETGEIIDPFGGQRDLRIEELRHTSEAFAEDPLRVVRLCRFGARYSFFINDKTEKLCMDMVRSGELNVLSPERFMGEIEKVFDEANRQPHRYAVIISNFFALLNRFNVLRTVPFFEDLFGSKDLNYLVASMSLDIAVGTFETISDESFRLPAFIALAASKDAKMEHPCIPTRAKIAHKNYWKTLEIYSDKGDSAEAYFEIIQVARGWNLESTSIKDLTDLLSTVRNVRWHQRSFIPSGKVVQGARAWGLRVSAEQYPSFEGKALGEKIKQERINQIEQMLGAQDEG